MRRASFDDRQIASERELTEYFAFSGKLGDNKKVRIVAYNLKCARARNESYESVRERQQKRTS